MASRDADVVILGAGPSGLAAALQLQRAGISAAVFGSPMSFWRSMPQGMLLRSNWGATNIAEHRGPFSLDAFKAETGLEFEQPVPLEAFIAYGEWFQRRAVPDVDRRWITSISRNGGGFQIQLSGGDELTSRSVVVAAGIEGFAARPHLFEHLEAPLALHTSDVADPSRFAGASVAVVGGGQSALETAALLGEAGASVEVIHRRPSVVWLRGHAVIHRLGRLGPVVYAPTDVGPLWYSRLVSQPGIFTKLPRGTQAKIARRCIRPAGSHWLRERLESQTLTFGRTVTAAEQRGAGVELTLDDDSRRQVDHVILGTGYRVDINRYEFLAPELLRDVRQVAGYPVLGPGLSSSVPGLYFMGAPAAWSVGPIMRFVSGTWYGSRALADRIACS